MEKLNRKDILLLLLFAPGMSGDKAEAIKGRTRFTKLLFLLQELHGIDKAVKKYYSFEPYKLGPFTEELYNDLDVLETIGLVQVAVKEFVEESETVEAERIPRDLLTYADADAITAESYREYEYKLSDSGRKLAHELYNSVPESIRQAVEDVKTKFASLPLAELLRYIYRKFPEMGRKSIRTDLRG